MRAAAPAFIGRRIGDAPLTAPQEALWLVQRAEADLAAYNVALAYRLSGSVDVPLLERAITALVARHDALRTVVVAARDGPHARVLPPAPVRLVLDSPDALHAQANAAFDLAAAPAFRAVLARSSDDDHVLMLVTHHLFTDAASCVILWRELAALYSALVEGRSAELPPIALEFADYAAWRRASGAADEGNESYWRSQLRDVESLRLPEDRPLVDDSLDGACVRRTLSVRARESVRGLTARHRVTTYMVLLAAWQTVLHRRAEQDDIVVGSAILGRTRPETETMVGYFAQALPMRTSFAGDPTFAALLERVSETVVGAFEHQEVSLETVMAGAEVRHGSLFRAVLTMSEGPPEQLALGPLTAIPVDVDLRQTKFDLTLFPAERGDGLHCTLWFRTRLFDPNTAERMLAQLERVLEAAGEDAFVRVSAIDLLDVRERSIIMVANDGPPAAPRRPSPAAAVAAAARANPAATALRSGDRRLSYAELDTAVSRLAGALRRAGAVAGTRVAILAEASLETIVAMLAAHRAGAVFVPLAADGPPARLRRQLDACGARIVVASAQVASHITPDETVTIVDPAAQVETVPAAEPEANPEGAEDAAYVLLTSGTTGAPKGVVVTHRNVAAYTAAIIERLALAPATPLRFALCTTLAADLGYTSVFAALATGGSLDIVPSVVARDPAAFAEYAAAAAIDVLKTTPSHLHALLEATGDELTLPKRWIVLGGEPLSWALVDRLLRRDDRPRVLNHYGPTETTIGACTFELTEQSAARMRALGAQTAPIGTPLAGVRVAVRDRFGHQTPLGVPGELWIGGDGVAAGYEGDLALTSERFVVDARLGRAYRTGDRVRQLAGGELEFLSRGDRQVKLRGFRVELGEIECVVAAHPDVDRAVVVRDPSDAQACIAYVLPRPGACGDLAERVRAHARALLPASILPAAFVSLAALPLTANGKLDLAALPRPVAAGRDAGETRSETEAALAAIWAETLGRPEIGPLDDFFALGGHSLAAIRVLGRVSRDLSVRLPLRAMFDAPTVRALAHLIEERRTAGADARPGITRVARTAWGDVS